MKMDAEEIILFQKLHSSASLQIKLLFIKNYSFYLSEYLKDILAEF